MAEKQPKLQVEQIVKDVLATIEKEREREIVSRRYGLFDRKETLEQIGELLGITRERVRQLEKAIVTRLKAQAEQGNIPHIPEVETAVTGILNTKGHLARVSSLTTAVSTEDSKLSQARVAFLSVLAPKLVVIDENDFYYQSVAEASKFKDNKAVTKRVDEVVKAIKELGKPSSIAELSDAMKGANPASTEALASASKLLASLNGDWGLTKWPTVNPKNIRDKIYVILKENGSQMHFSEIAKKIKESDFKRKDVTTQAIHNELIKDDRFVLVGRGIYALKEWGFKKGTVADVITDVLKKAGEPLHRDEIVKRVLKNRYVKETTILLNLQGKKQFVRVAKATYTLSEE
jgi:DNA-directed RNA polymerase delta subunit